MRRLVVGIVAAAALFAGCEDDPPPPDRVGTVINVPLDAAFEEAVAMARMNDTIRVAAQVLLDSTVTIRTNQTPLVILGGKVASLVAPGGSQAALRLENPEAGTWIQFMRFRSLDGTGTAVDIAGGERVTISDCVFEPFTVQVRATGGVLSLGWNIMENPGLFSVDAFSGARVTAFNNTLVGAGDCGIRLNTASELIATNNLIAEYANYGIACTGTSVLDPASGCNDIFDGDGSGAPFLGCSADTSNFFENPLFCDPENGDWSVASDSPCLTHDTCGVVGAVAVAGCSEASSPRLR